MPKGRAEAGTAEPAAIGWLELLEPGQFVVQTNVPGLGDAEIGVPVVVNRPSQQKCLVQPGGAFDSAAIVKPAHLEQRRVRRRQDQATVGRLATANAMCRGGGTISYSTPSIR